MGENLLMGHEWIIREDVEKEGHYLLLNIVEGDSYEINEPAKFLLDLCNGRHTIEEIALQYSDQHTDLSPEDIATEEDIRKFLDFLLEKGICRIMRGVE